VLESSPSILNFTKRLPVSDGFVESHSMTVYHDSISQTAPLQRNNNVVKLVSLTASLSSIQKTLPREKGADGKKYYILKGAIEAAYGSASTEYTLLYGGEAISTTK
jgi:hypothetical protein